jgi:hypothetical protein
MMALMTVTMPFTMAMKQLVIAWTTELNYRGVSDGNASAGLGRPREGRIVRRMRRRPLLRCCGLFVWCGGGVVGCEDSIGVDAIDDVGRWMGWLDVGEEGRGKGRINSRKGVSNGISAAAGYTKECAAGACDTLA